ncbi:hypothetical protein [Microbacterium sp. NPDC087591]|uniref:hypothetical protein n=1 Tax=Microbacterium sp. NPDC087591 TaxID=3364192 RepID=UPI003820EF07
MWSYDDDRAFEALALAAERNELVSIPGTDFRGKELRDLLERAREEHVEDLEGFLGALFDIGTKGSAVQ